MAALIIQHLHGLALDHVSDARSGLVAGAEFQRQRSRFPRSHRHRPRQRIAARAHGQLRGGQFLPVHPQFDWQLLVLCHRGFNQRGGGEFGLPQNTRWRTDFAQGQIGAGQQTIFTRHKIDGHAALHRFRREFTGIVRAGVEPVGETRNGGGILRQGLPQGGEQVGLAAGGAGVNGVLQ